MVTGRTPKGSSGPLSPGSYRPITCLNTTYKVFTSVLTEIFSERLTSNDIIPVEQKAIRTGRRGCLDTLLTDKMICEDSRIRGEPLAMAWINFSKAYDNVSHEWLLAVLEAIQAPPSITNIISSLFPMRRTSFSIEGGSPTRELPYKRGLFQGDALSPLLFCLSLSSLSHERLQTTGLSRLNHTPPIHGRPQALRRRRNGAGLHNL